MTSISQEIFSSEISIAFLWLLVANLAISHPHLSTLIGCAATGHAIFCKNKNKNFFSLQNKGIV